MIAHLNSIDKKIKIEGGDNIGGTSIFFSSKAILKNMMEREGRRVRDLLISIGPQLQTRILFLQCYCSGMPAFK